MSRRSKVNYCDGTWFAVPLREIDGFGVGVVAAHDGNGIVIGYFLSARYLEVPEFDAVRRCERSQVMAAFRCGDLGLIRGRWPIVGTDGEWDAASWPIPEFCQGGRTGDGMKQVFVRSDLSRPASQVRVGADECRQLERGGLYGAGAVELAISARIRTTEFKGGEFKGGEFKGGEFEG